MSQKRYRCYRTLLYAGGGTKAVSNWKKSLAIFEDRTQTSTDIKGHVGLGFSDRTHLSHYVHENIMLILWKATMRLKNMVVRGK